MNRSKPAWLVVSTVAAAALLHLLLWLPLPLVWSAFCIYLLTNLLPGLLLVYWLVGQSDAPPAWWEQLLYATGVGYGVMSLTMLLVSYLPGGVTAGQTLLAFDLVVVLLLAFGWYSQAANLAAAESRQPVDASGVRPLLGWPALGVVILLGVGGFLRFANLGYAEFVSDEARVVLRAAAVIQGQADVLFLHNKGPVEILLPTVIYALTGHLDEASARLPFALANLLALLGVFRLGWQWVGPRAGWLAAFLLAFDGYLIGFARFVQYQSVVLLTATLAVMVLYRLLRQPAAMTRYLILTALLLATALLAHYDGLAVLVPIGLLLLVLFWQQRRQPGGLLRSLAIAVGVAALFLATFYLPFVRHPSFQSTFYYVVYLRIGSNRVFPYNNLPELMQRNMVYNPWLWVWVFNGLLVGALLWSYRQGWGQRWGNGLGLVALVVSALLLWRSDWLTINGGSYLCVPVLLALVLAWSAPRLTLEGRILWLWFGLPFWLSAFLMGAPGTHTYVYTVPGILLVSALVEPLWPTLQRRAGQRLSSGLAVVTVGVVGLLLGRYAYAYFVDHQTELLLTQQDAKPETANAADNRFEIDRLYGFPLANGWKVVGALYQAGVLQGDFETNQHRDYIPAWYTRGVHRCGSSATWYFAIDNFEFWTADNQAMEDLIKSQNFRRWGVVQVNGHPGMVIYKRDGDKQPPKSLLLDEYAPRFDALATPDLPLSYPVINPTIAQPLHSNFEHKIWLEGYQLAGKMPLKPGDTFRLTLYWRAQAPIDQSYKVFTQSYYGNGTMIAQQDSYPVCDRQLTNAWVPGELVADVHDLTIAADAPSGVYPLYTGLYLEATSQRLAVLDTAGAPSDNQVHVADLQVQGDTTQ